MEVMPQFLERPSKILIHPTIFDLDPIGEVLVMKPRRGDRLSRGEVFIDEM
jgi:hypothetical protein